LMAKSCWRIRDICCRKSKPSLETDHVMPNRTTSVQTALPQPNDITIPQ